MNFYEEYMIKLQKRIKRIDEDPDPAKPRSNKLRYQIELKLAQEQHEAWQHGKPFSDGGSMTAGVLTRAMGFTPVGGVQPAFQTMQPQKYLEQARSAGLPVDKSCDMTMMPFAMMVMGDVPMEDLAICDRHCCTPMKLRGIYVAHSSDTLTYFVDVPFEENERALEYVTRQLRNFIEFAEDKFPGIIKYDEDKLSEMQAYEEAIADIGEEMHDMMRHRPAPVSGRGGGGGAGFFGAGRLDLEYACALRDEMADRIERGIASVPGEKLRVLWTGVSNPVFMDPYRVLAKWGIATVRGMGGRRGGLTHWGDWGTKKLEPLEKVAARSIKDSRSSLGSVYVDGVLSHAKDMDVDGIVNYNMRGCTCALGLKRIIEERAERELGVPVLQLEGAQWDSSYANEATITAQLDAFAQILLSK